MVVGVQLEAAVLVQIASQHPVPSQTRIQAQNYSAALREWLTAIAVIQRTSKIEESTQRTLLLTRIIVKETARRNADLTVVQMTRMTSPSNH